MKGVQLPVFNFSIKNQSDNSADIFIDGDIVDASTQEILKNWYGDDTSTSYKSFREAIDALNVKTLNVYVNSGGGQITEAMAIHDLLTDLQDKGKTVNTIGRGIIASAATYILMAGKNPSMSSNSFLMVHNASGAIWGNVTEIENYAVTLRKFNDQVNTFYQKATGLSKTVIANMMDAETWLTADEAKTKGFVKNVTGEASFSNSIKPEKWLFNNTTILNSYNSFVTKTVKNISDSEKNYLQQMIPLQQKAIDLSKAVLQSTTDPFVQSLAGSIIEDQTDNIEDMQEQLNGTAEPEENISHSKTTIMDTTKITEAITNGFNSMLEKLGLKDKQNDENVKNAFTEFSNSITKPLEDLKVPDETSITEMVNKAVAESMKTLPENFTNAITDATKEVVTKTDFKNAMDELTKSITDKLGSGTTGEEKKKNEKKNGVRNRFAEAYENYYEN